MRGHVLALALLLLLAGCQTKEGARELQPSAAIEETNPVEEQMTLTGEELRFFEEQLFNTGSGTEGVSPDQFLTSEYTDIRQIDLGELFYQGSRLATVEEQRAAFGEELWAECGFAITEREMDACLSTYGGLTLAETDRVGLDRFSYLPEQGLYVIAHGDTNAMGEIRFLAGVQSGMRVRLYYEWSGQTRQVELQGTEDGRWLFVSHMSCQPIAIPPALPEGEVERTIDLSTLPAQMEQNVELPVADPPADYIRMNYLEGGLWVYQVPFGENVCVVQVQQDGTVRSLCEGVETWWVDYREDLFGRDTIRLTAGGREYLLAREENEQASVYWSFPAEKQAVRADLDGNGTEELAGEDLLLFQREDGLVQLSLTEQVGACYPELQGLTACFDRLSRCFYVTGEMVRSDAGPIPWQKVVYFNGESLLVYPVPQ